MIGRAARLPFVLYICELKRFKLKAPKRGKIYFFFGCYFRNITLIHQGLTFYGGVTQLVRVGVLYASGHRFKSYHPYHSTFDFLK